MIRRPFSIFQLHCRTASATVHYEVDVAFIQIKAKQKKSFWTFHVISLIQLPISLRTTFKAAGCCLSHE